VLGPRRPRDGEDRLEVEGVRAAEALVVVAREEEAQERAAQGLGAELVHGFRPFFAALGCCWCYSTKSGSFCGAFAGVAQECRVRRPRPGVRQQCGREVEPGAALSGFVEVSWIQQRPRVPRANADFGRADPSEEPLPTRARLAAAASSALTVRVAAAVAARRLRSCARAEASVYNPRVSL
jgi:hypothetical protein